LRMYCGNDRRKNDHGSRRAESLARGHARALPIARQELRRVANDISQFRRFDVNQDVFQPSA
jgi:hypothetical protein